jgi:hypothetical protein
MAASAWPEEHEQSKTRLYESNHRVPIGTLKTLTIERTVSKKKQGKRKFKNNKKGKSI